MLSVWPFLKPLIMRKVCNETYSHLKLCNVCIYILHISLIVSWWFTILQLGEIEHQLVKAPRAGCCYQSMLSVVIMFCTTSFPDLSKLYKLLRNIPRGLQAMVAELEEHITKTGRNLVTLYCCTNCT